jgi:hypothetical protein
VKINFRSLSPRAFIFIRAIMTQLLNAHRVFRLTYYHQHGKLERSTSYRGLKQALNSHSTCKNFLFHIRHWNPSGASSLTRISKLYVGPGVSTRVPKRNRLDFFNSETGKRIRLSNARHDHLSGCAPGRGYICCGRTTARCSVREISLCRTPFGSRRVACWYKHHNNDKV